MLWYIFVSQGNTWTSALLAAELPHLKLLGIMPQINISQELSPGMNSEQSSVLFASDYEWGSHDCVKLV